ncbi:hypothetical protein DWX12_09210 [Bifidobacterium pseudocatenulatum]|nr:hypothetical protein DWX12_09210 [Bifidobacterium pseudocatenulatum]
MTAFGDALLAKGVARRALISASVKKGAQNVKNSIRDDLNGSGNAAFRRIPISYTLQESAGRITAEIGPTKGGAGSLANIAFFGTARGGGTHQSTSTARKNCRSSRNTWRVPPWRWSE